MITRRQLENEGLSATAYKNALDANTETTLFGRRLGIGAEQNALDAARKARTLGDTIAKGDRLTPWSSVDNLGGKGAFKTFRGIARMGPVMRSRIGERVANGTAISAFEPAVRASYVDRRFATDDFAYGEQHA